MKQFTLVAAVSAMFLAGCSSSPTVSDTAKTVHLNKNIGFAVKGYSYEQEELSCNLKAALVEQLQKKAAQSNIKLVTTSKVSELKAADRILALDISELRLNSEDRDHVGHSMTEPKLGVMAAFADQTSDNDIATIEKSCTAFTNTKALDGAASGGVCHQLLSCTKRLSAKVIDWLEPQL